MYIFTVLHRALYLIVRSVLGIPGLYCWKLSWFKYRYKGNSTAFGLLVVVIAPFKFTESHERRLKCFAPLHRSSNSLKSSYNALKLIYFSIECILVHLEAILYSGETRNDEVTLAIIGLLWFSAFTFKNGTMWDGTNFNEISIVSSVRSSTPT